MSKSKVISVGIAVDLQNTQEISSQIQGMSKDLANMKLDKDLEPRLKNVEKTLAGAVKQISAMTDKIDVLSKAGGLDPKTLSDLSMLATAIADVKVEVDALSSRMNNFSKQLSNVGDVGVKQVAGNITKEIGNMATGIDTSLNNATKSIQEGGEKLKKSFEQLLQSVNAEVDEESIDVSKIFKLSNADDINDEFEKVKTKLQKDLKDLADTTAKYNDLKLNFGSADDIEKAAKAQVNALNKLKESFSAFYGMEDLSERAGDNVTKEMTASINEVIKSFPNLQGEVYRTFDEIYDFIDAVMENISNDFTSSINTIKKSLESVPLEIKEPTKKAVTESKVKTKSDKKNTTSDITTDVVIKEGVGAELIAELKAVINNLQKYVDKNPVELDAIINPSWGTTQTKKYIKSIKEQLANTKNGKIDEGLAERIYGLQDAFGKDFSDALNKSIAKLKDSLSKDGFSVGKLKIEDSAIKNFKEQLSNELGAVPININANIVEVKNQSEEINKQFEELEALDKIDPNKIMQLVNAIKETGATLDYSDLYKNRLKQIVKGLVDGIYGSVPEAIKKTKYPNGANPLIGEFNDNSRRIKELSSKIQGGGSDKSLSFYNQQLESLIKRQKEILGELSQDVEGVSESVAEEIKDAIQKIDAATIEVGTATINIANADATFTNANIASITSKSEIKTTQEISKESKKDKKVDNVQNAEQKVTNANVNITDAKVNTTSKTQEANLVANRDELIALANKRFHELLADEFNDKLNFKNIESFVKDLRKVGVTEFGSPKAIASSTTGRIIDAMLRNGYDDALQAFKSTTSSSEESKVKAQEAQQMSKLFQRFNKLYDMQTVQEKGLGSELSIKRFVDDVLKSGVDFKVAPQYQDNEIGKLINTMLTKGYKTVAEATNTNENVTTTNAHQNIEKANINVNSATINIKGTENIANAKQTINSATINVKKGISNKSKDINEKENNKNTSSNFEKLIKQYNTNIGNNLDESLIKFLNKQEKILLSIINSSKNDNVLEDIASEQYNNKYKTMIYPNNISEKAKKATKKLQKKLNTIKIIDKIYDNFIDNLTSNDIDLSKEMHFHVTKDRNNNKIYEEKSAITALKSDSTHSTPVSAYTVEKVHNHPSGVVIPSYADLINDFSALSNKIKQVDFEKKKGNYSNTFDEFASSIIDFGSGKLSTIDYSNLLNKNKNEIQDAFKNTIIKSLAAQFLSRVTLQGDDTISFNNKDTERLLRGSFLNKITDNNYSIYERNKQGEFVDVTNKELIPLTEDEIQKLNIVSNIIEELVNNLGTDIKNKNELSNFIDSNLFTIADKAIKNNAIISNDKLNKLYNGSDFFTEKAPTKMPFQSMLDMFIVGTNIEEDISGSNSNNLHKGINDYITKINEILASTTDETLKNALQIIKDELIENGQILLSSIDEPNENSVQIRLDAIQGIRNGINNLDIISNSLISKAKEINGFLNAIAGINNTINKGKDKNLSKSAQDTITKSKERIEELENIFKTAQNNNDYSEIDTESITEELINLQKTVGEAINQTVVDKLDVKGLIRKIDNLQINEVKTDPAVLSRVRELRRQLQEVANDDAREVLTEEYKGWAKEISQLTGTVSKSDRTFFGNFMKEWRHKNYQMLAQFFSFYDIIRYMREAVTVVKQYDSALIEMMKVSDETRYSLERYQQTLFDTADAIGSSALTLEQSTADWMRIGESLTEAAESAKAAQILMNVSEFQDINSATQALVSASQAYAELDKMEIVDKINKLGNEFPIATDQLATALQNSAAALTTQGNDLNEALALVVGGNVITQDALKTGTGIRTIALRIAGTKEAKDELAELGEGVDDFVVRTESKTRKLIMDYTAVASNGFKGVDIYNENGNLRSTYEIMQDIADIYKEIQLEDRQAGTNRANALVELLAGKNRSNIAASILTNPDTIREAYEAAQDAEGSAMRENEKYLTSVEAHMTMFKNSVDELITSLVDSGFINDVIDFGTTLINGLKEITDLLGGVGTALAGLGVGVAAKSHVFTDKNYGLLNAVKTLRTPNIAAPTILGVEDVANNLTDLNDLRGKKITKEAKDYLMTQIGTSPKSIAKVESAVEGLTDAQNAAAEAAALHAAKMSAMVNIGVAVASVIATVIVTAYAKYKQSIREAQQAARDLANENQETNKSLEDYAKRIADCNKVIKDNRSTTDEIIAAENELKDIQDELNESFDNYSTLIGDVNAGLEAQNKLLITNRQIKNKETVDTARGTKTGWGNNELEETIAFFEEGKFRGFDSGSTLYQALQNLGYGQFVKYDEKTNEHYFTTGNIEDDIKILKQARTQADDTTAEYITAYIDELQKELDERQSTYLAYGETEAADKYGDLYDLLMDSYIKNVQENTEETEEALKQNLKNLYFGTDNKSIKNWLSSDSYFKNYMSDILASEVDNTLRSTTVTAALRRRNESESQTAEQYLGSLGERANNYGLTSEDIRKYLSGLTSGFSEDQEKVLLEIQRVINETGLLNDEAINWLLNNSNVRDNDRTTLDNKIAEARKKAMESGLMTGEQFDSLGIKTSETLDVWNQKVFGTAKTYEEAAHMLALATSDLDKALDASTMLKNMESQYKPVFNSMAEAYKAIWSTDGFDISEVSSEQIESVRAQIESLDASLKEAGGEGFNTDAVNEFIMTLSTSEILSDEFATKEEEVQEAFNNIATILVDSLNPALSQASGETAALMQKTLTEMGVTNAEAVVMSRLGYTMETYAAAKEAAAEADIDIDKELGAFDDEELRAIATTEALSDYYNARILANSLDIQTSDDVKNLIKLCDQLDISIDKIQGLAEAKKKLEYVESLESQLKTAREDGNNSYQIAALEKQLDSAQADLDSYLERVEVKYESDVEIENPNYDGNSSKSSSTSSKSDSKQKFDWIERAIKKIQRAVTNLGKVADATYKKWEERLGGVTGKYEKLQEEILLQQQAADAYMQEAYAVGLNPVYMDKVMNGMMDIETVTDEKLKEQISDFQDYYDRANECIDTVQDLEQEIANLAQTRFDNITKQFEEMALAIDHAANRIGSIQNKIASEGYFESTALIKQLKAGNEEKLGQLKEEAAALAASIDEAVTNGDIEYGSEQWWGMYDALQNVNDQIVEMGATIADLNDQLRQLEWDKFDYIANAVNRLTEENNFLIDVLKGEELMFEKIAYIGEDLYANGNMSDAALAVQGLHVNNLKILEKQNETYADEIKKINKELANDPNNKKILERRNDLIDQQQDIIKGIDDEKHAIKDLIQEGYETFLDYLQKSIDKRKEALEAQKSLYDYENTVAEQTKAIASYQKQISALGGDDSEETQARLQELANNLNAAEKELQQTEYEQWLSDQEKMMDNMYNSFEKLINDRLDDLDGLVEQAIQQTADSAVGISQTIQTEADEFLYELDNTSFGMNIDARMSDVIGVVNNVENAINNMITAANVNASNELAQLQALAATVATQAAVSAAQRQAQINATPSSSSSSNSTNTTTSTTQKTKVDNSAEIKKHKSLLESYRQVYVMYNQRAEVIGSKQSHNTAEYQQNRALYLQYKNKADEAQKKMEEEQKQIDKLKKAAYAKGGIIGNAVKKTGEDGIILARSGEEVLSLERVKQMQGIFKMMQPLAAMNPKTISNIGGNTTVNGMNVSFALPNVTSYEDFVQKAKSDPTFEKIVQSMTIGTSLGKNKLSKYSL